MAQHACGVSNCSAGLDGRERDDLGDVLTAIQLGHVADHLVPVPRVEVHVDVGHRPTARIQEALEQQVVFDRIQVGDPQAIRDCTACGRTTARTDADVAVAGVLDQVTGDQEVRREAHVVKYDEKPMSLMTLSSNAKRSTVVSGSTSPQRFLAPSNVRCSRYS